MIKDNPEFASLLKLAHSPVSNYIVPGLTSYLIGNEGSMGCIRMFVSSRQQHVHVAPHSHRYDFTARVVAGQVINRVWRKHTAALKDSQADTYMERALTYKGVPGQYEVSDLTASHYTSAVKSYSATREDGRDCQYSMAHDEIHSIVFDKDTAVLMLQGPDVIAHSIMLLPYVDGEVCDTGKVEPWMFKRTPSPTH